MDENKRLVEKKPTTPNYLCRLSPGRGKQPQSYDCRVTVDSLLIAVNAFLTLPSSGIWPICQYQLGRMACPAPCCSGLLVGTSLCYMEEGESAVMLESGLALGWDKKSTGWFGGRELLWCWQESQVWVLSPGSSTSPRRTGDAWGSANALPLHPRNCLDGGWEQSTAGCP